MFHVKHSHFFVTNVEKNLAARPWSQACRVHNLTYVIKNFSAFPQPMYLKILSLNYTFCTKKQLTFVHFAYCIIKKFFV